MLLEKKKGVNKMSKYHFYRKASTWRELPDGGELRTASAGYLLDIVDELLLEQFEFENFRASLLRDYPFVSVLKELLYFDQNVAHCLLVSSVEGPEFQGSPSILVVSEGYDYPRYTALYRDGK